MKTNNCPDMWSEPAFVAPVKEPDESDENPVEYGFELPCFRKAGDIQDQRLTYTLVDNALYLLNNDAISKTLACEGCSEKQQKNINSYFAAKADGIKALLKQMSYYIADDPNYLLNCLEELNHWQNQKENQR